VYTYFNYNKLSLPINELLSAENEAGLLNIKAILYEKPGFLLISTLVLLVALMGAAIMTRSSRK